MGDDMADDDLTDEEALKQAREILAGHHSVTIETVHGCRAYVLGDEDRYAYDPGWVDELVAKGFRVCYRNNGNPIWIQVFGGTHWAMENGTFKPHKYREIPE
jgi:hypothetical protein